MNDFELLEKLSTAFGPSGYEDEIVEILEEELKGACELKRVGTGSLLAVKRGKGNGKVLVSAHIDEIGLAISKVEENYGRLVMIGGVDPKVLPSQKLKIRTRDGFQRGVVGMLAPHLQKPGEKKNVDFESLFVDLGCSPAAAVGDVAVVEARSGKIDEDHLYGKALDNRSSVVALVLAIKALSKTEHEADLYALFSSREEVGGIGALTGAAGVKPDIGIAVDVTFGDDDSPYAPKVELNKGPAIATGAAIHRKSYEFAVDLAKKNDIPCQIEPTPGRTGTDADSIQLAHRGVPVLLFSVPLLHMHTPAEVVSMKDVRWTARLLSTFVTEWDGSHVS